MQDEVFSAEEGNNWFRRNRDKILSEGWLDDDPILRVMGFIGMAPNSVLEIGAACGYRLGEIQKRYGCRCAGIDPSEEAIQEGRNRLPDIRFEVGVASRLPFPDHEFDLIIVNFVFHWIDRLTLFRSAAEIDRVLADRGFLIIGDFAPDCPQKVFYHHLPQDDVWTYKQDYPSLFVSSCLYDTTAKVHFDCMTKVFGPAHEISNRGAVTVLHKTAGGVHLESKP